MTKGLEKCPDARLQQIAWANMLFLCVPVSGWWFGVHGVTHLIVDIGWTAAVVGGLLSPCAVADYFQLQAALRRRREERNLQERSRVTEQERREAEAEMRGETVFAQGVRVRLEQQPKALPAVAPTSPPAVSSPKAPACVEGGRRKRALPQSNKKAKSVSSLESALTQRLAEQRWVRNGGSIQIFAENVTVNNYGTGGLPHISGEFETQFVPKDTARTDE